MSYVDDNLISGESVAYRTSLHWIVLLWPATITAFFVISSAALFFMAISRGSKNGGSVIAIMGGISLLVGAIVIGVGMLRRSSAEFAVTNKRVIFKTGMLDRRTAEMFLNKIESVGVDQGLGGRLFKYGSIVVRGTGGTLEPFSFVPNPLGFRRQVQEQIERSQQLGSAAPAGR